MANALILMLPRYSADAPGAIRRWWRVDGGAVVDSGDDGRWPDVTGEGAAVIALAPPEDVPVHYRLLPGLTPPQARAAAQAEAMAQSLGDALHCAASLPADDAMVATACAADGAMVQWIALLAANGVITDALVPVAAVLPAPHAGEAVRATLGLANVLRTESLSAVADDTVDTLRLAGLQVVDLGPRDDLLADLGAAVPLNLLSGPYAPRSATAVTPAQRRTLVWLAVALVVLTLGLPLAQAWQRSRAIDAADARTLTAAVRVGIQGKDAATAEAELDRRLAQRGGGPLALSAPLGGLYRSLQAQPPVAVRSLNHLANGTLSVTLASPRIEDVNAVLVDLQARGFVVTGQPLSGTDGMQMAAITVRAVP